MNDLILALTPYIFNYGLSLQLVFSLALRGFSLGTPVFPSPQKPTLSNSNLTRNQVDEEPIILVDVIPLNHFWLFIRLKTIYWAYYI